RSARTRSARESDTGLRMSCRTQKRTTAARRSPREDRASPAPGRQARAGGPGMGVGMGVRRAKWEPEAVNDIGGNCVPWLFIHGNPTARNLVLERFAPRCITR